MLQPLPYLKLDTDRGSECMTYKDRFDKVTDPTHLKGDDDCMCMGCIEILTELARDMAKKIRSEHRAD